MTSIELTPEQLQMIKIIDDYAIRFPYTETGDAELLQSCYDYMEAFKRVMDTTTSQQMDYICQNYDGFYRFAKMLELLAQGIADGVIEVPRGH